MIWNVYVVDFVLHCVIVYLLTVRVRAKSLDIITVSDVMANWIVVRESMFIEKAQSAFLHLSRKIFIKIALTSVVL